MLCSAVEIDNEEFRRAFLASGQYRPYRQSVSRQPFSTLENADDSSQAYISEHIVSTRAWFTYVA